ncbi:MAG TPA: CPBP family intramembrane glutamic endopeptidase [bacterium]|nr:CPBP family intramembrane glutamic endopeptidase [bacterium]
MRAVAWTFALVLLYQGGALLFLRVWERPLTGLMVTGPLLVLLPLLLGIRGARLPVGETLRWRPVPAGSFLAAVVGVVAALPPVLAAASRLLPTPDHVEEFFTRLLTARSPEELAVVLVAAAVVPAVTEEVLFRGFLQGALERRLGRWPAVLTAAAGFGLIHGAERAPVAFVMGILLGWTTGRTGSVLPAIAAHATVNAIAVTLVNSPGFAAGRGWPETLPWPALLIWSLVSGAALVSLRSPRGSDRSPSPEAEPPRPPR